MASTQRTESSDEKLDFARQPRPRQAGFLGEFWSFLRANKKWWLAPLAMMLMLIGIMVVLGGTVVAPFIYTLF